MLENLDIWLIRFASMSWNFLLQMAPLILVFSHSWPCILTPFSSFSCKMVSSSQSGKIPRVIFVKAKWHWAPFTHPWVITWTFFITPFSKLEVVIYNEKQKINIAKIGNTVIIYHLEISKVLYHGPLSDLPHPEH